jgi:hypothetical protein
VSIIPCEVFINFLVKKKRFSSFAIEEGSVFVKIKFIVLESQNVSDPNSFFGTLA